MPLEDLAHLDLERLDHVVQAAATRHAGLATHCADGHDSFGRRLDDEVDVESAVENTSLPHLEVGQDERGADVPSCTGPTLQFDDVDDETIGTAGGRPHHHSS